MPLVCDVWEHAHYLIFTYFCLRGQGIKWQRKGGNANRAGATDPRCVRDRRSKMLWTIAVVLIVLWLLGLVSSYTLGGFIHILLVLAIVVILFNVIQGRRA